MEPLLKTIAREYSKRYNNLKDLCFIFPNKRCGVFLRKYFLEFDVITEDLPHILTISEFVSQVAHKYEADKIVQIFTLYQAYLEIQNIVESDEDKLKNFESFRGWGEIVLADFNTVDLNMVEPDEIFKNVKDYRNISSNFLSEEQKEVMHDYFGIEDFGSSEEFWKNFEDPENLSSLKKKFLNLWQVLSPLHLLFISKLREKNLSTSGMIYKEAARKILGKGKDCLPYKKLVAVGFNALSESERIIFKTLKKEKGFPKLDDFIDFIWDINGPILTSHNFSASKFVESNLRHFPQPDWLIPALEKNNIEDFPEIHIHAAPSNTAQAKIAGEILKSFSQSSLQNCINEAEVALILPDENLLSNVLYSIPDGIDNINLTMGYPLRLTSVASFMALLRRIYANIRKKDDKILIYVKDLKLLLAHPFAEILFEISEIRELLDHISDYHKIFVSLEDAEKFITDISILFNTEGKHDSIGNIFEVLQNILNLLVEKISEEDPSAESNQDVQQIKIYGDCLVSLKKNLDDFKMNFEPAEILNLADRLISTEKIGFEGEPLIGLQVMGTLETRSIDFKHLIVLSMNEGIIPRKAIASSFIPESLRKAYGLPPARYAEEIFAYYFYRLISRAEKVDLIFDSRTVSGLKGGESRYLLQLKQYVPADKIQEDIWLYHLQGRETYPLRIEKNSEILKLIEKFSSPKEDRRNLSASSLNTYRECEVKFFLQNILDLNVDPEVEDFMDAISIGNILHEVMMDLYMPSELQKKLLLNPVVITQDLLDNILLNPSIINDLIITKINKLYYRNIENFKKIPESGVTQIMAQQIGKLAEEIVRYDKKFAPFELYGCEISKNIRVKMKSGRIVNFRFAIDRLDRIDIEGKKKIRIVDYKTGGRKRKASSLEEVFEGGYKSEQIFQLFTYAWLLDHLDLNEIDDIVTEIYYVPDLIANKGGLPEIEKKKVESYKEYREEFSQGMESLIESIFTSEAFEPTSDRNLCEMCGFKSFCGT